MITFKNRPKNDCEAIVESPFYVLGDGRDNQTDEFYSYVDAIESCGCGAHSSSLDALAFAFKTNWCKGRGNNCYIMMFTNSIANPLGSIDRSLHSEEMPKSFKELQDVWESLEIQLNAKRLIVYAPDCEPWTDMENWSNVYHDSYLFDAEFPEIEIETCMRICFGDC